jgi:hypothetical protein
MSNGNDVQLAFKLVVYFIQLGLEVSRESSRCGVESLILAELVEVHCTDLLHDIFGKLRKTIILLLFVFRLFAFFNIEDGRNKLIGGTIWSDIWRRSREGWDWDQLISW